METTKRRKHLKKIWLDFFVLTRDNKGDMKKKLDTNRALVIAIGIAVLFVVLYFLRNQSYIDSLLQLLIVVFTSFTAYSAYQSSRASEKSTRATFLPILKLDTDEVNKEKFKLSLKNIGTQLAQKIEVHVQKAYLDPEVKEGYRKKIQTIEVDQSEFEYLYYSPDELSRHPYVVVTYRDVFGGNVKTVGKFIFKKDDNNMSDEVDGVIWEFTLDY